MFGRIKRGPLQEKSTSEMVWAVKRPANEPPTGLFAGLLMAQFYVSYTGPLAIFEIPLHFGDTSLCK